MSAPTSPKLNSMLSTPSARNNFIAIQSTQLAVTGSSSSVTFTDIPGTGRITAMFTNTGANGCYLASGNGSAIAVLSSATPVPTSGSNSVSTCDYIPATKTPIIRDFIAGTNTFAGICSGGSTTLEISVGYGSS